MPLLLLLLLLQYFLWNNNGYVLKTSTCIVKITMIDVTVNLISNAATAFVTNAAISSDVAEFCLICFLFSYQS